VPLVLQCQPELSLDDVAGWIKEHVGILEKKLSEHGAILFRGFPLDSAVALNTFVNSFVGWQDLSYSESLSVAVRTHITGRVCTTNDGKNGGLIFHHEMAQTPIWPSKIFFYCQTPAAEGGATGITSSKLVYRALKEKFPQFIEKCHGLGVKYTLYLGPEQDISKGAGRSWKSLWGSEIREEVEKKMKGFGYTWEWQEGDLLKCTTPVLKSIQTAPGTDQFVFFNQLIAQTQNAKEWRQRAGGQDSTGLDRFMTFGDGSSIEEAPLEYAHKISNDNAVEIEWQKGDVGLLDNYLVMHARRPFEGNRQVYASLVV